MKIDRLVLQGFTVFDKADFEFSPGINVLIGENATGKSHVLKLIHACLRSTRDTPKTTDEAARKITERLLGTFRPDERKLAHLVRSGMPGADLNLTSDQGELKLAIDTQGDLRVPVFKLKKVNSTFIPPREFLAAFENFSAAYDDRDLSFDETYRDLCGALARAMPKGKAKAAADALRAKLASLPTGTIKLDNGRFFVDMGDGEREAHLVAEGWRKIMMLAYLVTNASIEQDSVLLWDEPETGLNPKLVFELVSILHELSAAGVQILLATHDYLLAHQLSLRSEHQRIEPPMRFFSLYRSTVRDPVVVERAGTLADIAHNPILKAYARHAEEEERLVAEQIQRESYRGAK